MGRAVCAIRKQASTVHMKGFIFSSPVCENVIASVEYSTQKHWLDTHKERQNVLIKALLCAADCVTFLLI